MAEIFSNFLMQILFSLGLVAVFGLLIALCRRVFCQITGDVGYKIILATGLIGTPIHELSHALLCLVFRHRIVAIKLYDPDNDDGTLGYVNHSYDPSSLYQQIGNFFIGIAPILGGSAVIILLMSLLTPSVYGDVLAELKFMSLIDFSSFSFSTIGDFFSVMTDIAGSIFSTANMGNFMWWLFIILAIMIASHMELSGADIKGGIKGMLILLAIVLVVDVFLGLVFPSALVGFTNAIVFFAGSVVGFLAIAVAFLVLMVLIALAVKGIISIKK